MVVTTSTIDRQPQKHLTRSRNEIVELIVQCEFLIGRVVVPNPQSIKTRGDQAIRTTVRKFISGQLFPNELVIGLIAVEGANDVVAVPPGVRFSLVGLVTVGLSEAHQIKPMTSPLLAVMRGLQQAIDQVFPSLCRWVVNEGLDGLRRRRQAGEIVGDPSNQRRPGSCLRNR